MRTFLIFLVVTIALAVLGCAGFFLYTGGYTSGETTGYENGYTAGEAYGFTRGEEKGYASGYTSGYTEGETTGYETGYEDGELIGYDAGYEEGEKKGYREGYSLGQTEGYDTGYESGYTVGMEEAAGHGYALRDPTYAEALSFMRQDTTSENEYIEDEYGIYVCSHFSRDTGNNAENAGYRCALVELRYALSGHTIIAFNTIDRGLVYFEPQTDELVNPEIGKRYYQCVVTAPGLYYKVPEYDDTILDMLVIW